MCRDKLENLKLKNFLKETNFFDEFEKGVNELKMAGARERTATICVEGVTVKF